MRSVWAIHVRFRHIQRKLAAELVKETPMILAHYPEFMI